MSYKVLDINFLTENTFVLRTEKPSYKILPGQCFNLGVSGSGVNREYSIYSGVNDNFLEFLIRKVPEGVVSSELSNLVVGDAIDIDGPYGEFVIDEQHLKKKFIFCATGTGIAPFNSFVKSFNDLNYLLLHGVRYENEQYNSNDYEKGSYLSFISSKGKRVTQFFEKQFPKDETIVYLCGNRSMITDVYDLLSLNNFDTNNIITEVFF